MKNINEQIFCHLGAKYPVMVKSVKNPHNPSLYFNKPLGGLWVCIYTPTDKYRSEWEKWCEYEEFKHYEPSDHFLFKLTGEAKILVIESIEDYENIDDIFKNEYGTLNWDMLQNFYDGIYVGQSHGYWCCCPFDTPAHSLEGWDVKSLVVFNNKVITTII